MKRKVSLIVDANRGHCFRPGAVTPEAREILIRIQRNTISITTGGKNLAELSETKFVRYIKEYRGSAVTIVDSRMIDAERKKIANLHLKSDDNHVIALARISSGRILFSDDNRLIDDFTNKELLARPRGRVFKRLDDHRHLLDECAT